MATILAVDDIEDNVFLLTIILEGLGHTVLPAYNGVEAIQAARKFPIDLILLDIMMPGMTGLDVASRLKDEEATRHIPIIMLTARKSEVADVVEGLNSGADEYITKPFKEPELVARVASMLRMKTLYDEVARAKEVMEEELSLAQTMQTSLLPETYPYGDQIIFTSRYQAASRVGGDFFDVIDIGDGKVAMLVADVSGHGPSAALVTAMIKVMLAASVQQAKTPAAITHDMNEQLVRMTPPERFATLFLGIYDINERALTYVRCGHPFPFILRANGDVGPLKAHGDLVGMFEEITLEEETVTLAPGERLFAYSDGIVEAQDGAEGQFGMRRLQQILKAGSGDTCEDILDRIMERVFSHSGSRELEDDAVLFMMRVI